MPLYPFGFGLGYSTFGYAALVVSHAVLLAASDPSAELSVSVAVTNRGEYAAGPSSEVGMLSNPTPTPPPTPTPSAHPNRDRDPEQVVMLFARPSRLEAAPPSTPRQMLLAFERVEVPPGRTATAALRVPSKRLRLVGADGSFALQRGEYELFVGGRAPGDALGTPRGSAGEPLRRVLRVV